MTEESTNKKPERPVFHISIPTLFLLGFFITAEVVILLEKILRPTVDNWHGITDPLFLSIVNIISIIFLGCIVGVIFYGWFYFRGYRGGLVVSRKKLNSIFAIGGVISALTLMFFFMYMDGCIDALNWWGEWWGINDEVVSYLLLLPLFVPSLLWAEIGFRVAKKLNRIK
jgi:hypothetical protein